MIIALLLGLYFAFFGYKAQRLLTLLTSIAGGGLIALASALLLQSRAATIALLADGYTPSHLVDLIIPTPLGLPLLVNVISVSVGSLALFLIARLDNRLSRLLVSLLCSASVAIAALFILRLLLPFTMSALLASFVALTLFIVSLFFRDLYLAFISAVTSSMVLALLVTRFWYLERWIFYIVWVAVALLGFLNQRQMIKAKEAERA